MLNSSLSLAISAQIIYWSLCISSRRAQIHQETPSQYRSHCHSRTHTLKYLSLHTHILWLTTRDICLALCTPPHRILLFFFVYFRLFFFQKKNLSSGECLAWALYMVPVSSIMFYMFSCAINVFVSVHSTSLWPLRFVFAKRFQTNITHVDFTAREWLNRWYARPKQSYDRIRI